MSLPFWGAWTGTTSLLTGWAPWGSTWCVVDAQSALIRQRNGVSNGLSVTRRHAGPPQPLSFHRITFVATPTLSFLSKKTLSQLCLKSGWWSKGLHGPAHQIQVCAIPLLVVWAMLGWSEMLWSLTPATSFPWLEVFEGIEALPAEWWRPWGNLSRRKLSILGGETGPWAPAWGGTVPSSLRTTASSILSTAALLLSSSERGTPRPWATGPPVQV